jgi:hypothetical protein
VHHGGAGTTTTAAGAGTPQVVVPQIADQPYWAARVAELGIGSAHDGPTPTFDSLSPALRTALTPETRARARAVAGAIRTDGATVAAKMLLDAVSQDRRPCPREPHGIVELGTDGRPATTSARGPFLPYSGGTPSSATAPTSARFQWGFRNDETTAWRRGGAPPIDDLRVPTAGE